MVKLLLPVLCNRPAWDKASLWCLVAPHTCLRFICICHGPLCLKGDSGLDLFPFRRESWVPSFLFLPPQTVKKRDLLSTLSECLQFFIVISFAVVAGTQSLCTWLTLSYRAPDLQLIIWGSSLNLSTACKFLSLEVCVHVGVCNVVQSHGDAVRGWPQVLLQQHLWSHMCLRFFFKCYICVGCISQPL